MQSVRETKLLMPASVRQSFHHCCPPAAQVGRNTVNKSGGRAGKCYSNVKHPAAGGCAGEDGLWFRVLFGSNM